MNKLGLIRNFDNLECCDIFTSKPLLYSSYAEGWSEKILTVPKLRKYITFKTSYTAGSSHRCGFAPCKGHEFICETSHVLLAGVSGGFSPGTPGFAPPTD